VQKQAHELIRRKNIKFCSFSFLKVSQEPTPYCKQYSKYQLLVCCCFNPKI
jgi:hypothetical protein